MIKFLLPEFGQDGIIFGSQSRPMDLAALCTSSVQSISTHRLPSQEMLDLR